MHNTRRLLNYIHQEVMDVLPNLKKLRQEFGVSQQRLADAIQVSQQSINQYENHSVEPDITVLCRMADYFNTSVDYIVGHTDVRRRVEHTEPCALNQNELEIITQYRALRTGEQACIALMLRTLMDK